MTACCAPLCCHFEGTLYVAYFTLSVVSQQHDQMTLLVLKGIFMRINARLTDIELD